MRSGRSGTHASSDRTLTIAALDGSLAMFTPFDPLFLAISYLSTLPPHFTSYADVWESIAQRPFEASGAAAPEDDAGQFVEDLTRFGHLDLVRERFAAVCDSQGECAAYMRLAQLASD